MTEHSDFEQFVGRLLRASSRAALDREGLLAKSSDEAEICRTLEPLWDAAELEVTGVRVNGNRLDVRIQCHDGRAWLAVLWVDDARPPALVTVTVYERPSAFEATKADSLWC
jgi:hypothetical protein